MKVPESVKVLDDHELILPVSDPEFGNLGYFVKDSAYYKQTPCGVRILPDISLEEISHNARTQTKKSLFSGCPMNGAKAGIILSGKAASDRKGALSAFGRFLKEHLQKGLYLHYDMGSTYADMCDIFEGAGINLDRNREATPTHLYTAWTIMASTGAALEHKEMSWSGCRIAIEGFGRVGSEFARLASEKGAKIVSVSNTLGSVSDSNGLDMGNILEVHSQEGREFINHYDKEPVEKVFSADCDVFVPCARPWSVNESTKDMITAPVIVAGSNVPMTMECERYLWEKGKSIVPDGVSNCGGFFIGWLDFYAGFSDKEKISSLLENRFKERVHQILQQNEVPSVHLDSFCSKRKKLIESGQGTGEDILGSLFPE